MFSEFNEEGDREAWDAFMLAYSQGDIDETEKPDNVANVDRYLAELGGWLAAPLRLDEPDRMKAFDRYSEDILQAYKDAGSDLKLDGYTRLAASLCGTPVSLLNLLDSNTQWVTSEYGLSSWRNITLPRSHTFCAHTILRRRREVFIVTDARKDWRFAKMPMVCGPPFVQSYMGAPLTTSDGQNIGALCVLDTVSDRPSFTDQQKAGLIDLADTVMRELDLRADRLVARKAKKVFLSSISHELRSPLHGLLASTELVIDDGHLTPFQDLCVKTISNCGRTLCDVIEQVLCFSDSDGPACKLEEVDLPTFLEEVIDATWAGKSQAKSKKQKLDVLIDVDMTHLRHAFKFNRGEIGRIIMNLFGNAVKYTEAGYLSVKLYAKEPAYHEQGRRLQHVTLVFADSGKGIAPDFIPKLFTPFAQQDQMCEGFGLGMSLVKQLVDKNNGSISVESEVNKGTTITVSLLLETIKHVVDEVATFPASHGALRGTRFTVYKCNIESLLDANLVKTCQESLDMISADLSSADVILVTDQDHLEELQSKALDIPIVVFAPGSRPDSQHTDYLRLPVGPFKLGKAISMALSHHEQKLYLARRTSIVHLDPVSPPTSCSIKEREPIYTTTLSDFRETDELNTVTNSSRPSSPQSDITNFSFGRSKAIKEHKYVDQSSDESVEAHSQNSEHSPNRPYCLIVDDNPVNVKILSTLLSKLEIRHKTAVNGEKALAMYKDSQPTFDIVFMDINMPIMNGVDASQHIREHEAKLSLPRSTIAALSGGGESDEVDARQSGIDLFFRKPVSMKDLTKFVNEF